MNDRSVVLDCSRREWLAGAVGIAGASVVPWTEAHAETEQATVQRVAKIIGAAPTMSNRVRLFMPKVFPNGYTVPLDVDVDGGLDDEDHATGVRILAPLNPIVEVAAFQFASGRAQARVSTRIRLAEPQFVAAEAKMTVGKLLMTRAWVAVETNGCQ